MKRKIVSAKQIFSGYARILISPSSASNPTAIRGAASGILGASASQPATAGWVDLGTTVDGTTLHYNFDAEDIQVDAVAAAVDQEITKSESTIETALAELSLENFQRFWEGSTITTKASAVGHVSERTIKFGTPQSQTARKVAFITESIDGKLRAYVFPICKRSGDSEQEYKVGGGVTKLPLTLKIFPDLTLPLDENLFYIIEEEE